MLTTLAFISALIAAPVLVLAVIYGRLFFKTRRAEYGRLNDIFAAIVLALLILPALATFKSVGATHGWFKTLAGLAIVGIVVGTTGQVLLVLRKISLKTSFITGGLCIVPVSVWLFSLAFLWLKGAL